MNQSFNMLERLIIIMAMRKEAFNQDVRKADNHMTVTKEELIEQLNVDLSHEYGAAIQYSYSASVVSGIYRSALRSGIFIYEPIIQHVRKVDHYYGNAKRSVQSRCKKG